MGNSRNLTSEEIALIEFLAMKSKIQLDKDWADRTLAIPFTQYPIGSIGLINKKSKGFIHECSRVISCCKFLDTDNVDVCVYLLVDSENVLYELDLWKVDNSEIHHIPSVDSMDDIPLIINKGLRK